MRYMMIVTGSENFAKSGPPPAALFEAIERMTEEYLENGKLVSFGGLHPTSTGARMRVKKISHRRARTQRAQRRQGCERVATKPCASPSNYTRASISARAR